MQGAGHLSSHPRGLSLTLSGLMLAAAMLTANCGCRTTHVVQATPDGAPQYERLRLVYDLVEPALHAGRDAAPLDLEYAKSRPVRAYLVSRRASPEEFKERGCLRLAIEYPAPDTAADVALVTLAEPDRPTGQWQAVAQQTLPREELDVLFVHLVYGGVCERETHLYGGTRIALEVDGTSLEKPWNREPRLDRLAVETYDACR